MDWSLDQDLMNIWFEFEVDQLKTHLCRVHTVKYEVGPQVATSITNRWQNVHLVLPNSPSFSFRKGIILGA